MNTLPLRVGVVGCGDVALTRYLPYLAHQSPYVTIAACADLDPARAQHAAERFGLAARTPAAVLGAADIDIVLNLTPPLAHRALNAEALERGKHVYSEKPYATTFADAQELNRRAARAGRRLASAPDTILGPNIQLAAGLIRQGTIGAPLMASISFVSADRSWHPNPQFFYREGAGPIFDEAPYFLSALVTLLGPIQEVWAASATYHREIRLAGGRAGDMTFPVEVPASYVAGLRLRSGVLVSMLISFEVRGTTMPPLEIYGEEGTLRLGFPGFYNGPVLFGREHDHITEVIRPEWCTALADARGIGVEELAQAIAAGTASRLEGDFPLHLLEAMEAIVAAGREGAPRRLSSDTARPAPYGPEDNTRSQTA